ncbi:hypothetical protein [Hymenobacter coccineus]|uniref:STAS/SEC14 domain-containing protein n=1 Tax=Hymenobacter coccineus TaxID=1908235 RepID=A0A1G1TJE9_9BACT|nr:hypothetical protein [Hymenobacter coccineus]OGX91002.1 hypothetical protein BEN49_05850 [Hymenobacter coccineus]
MRLHLLERLLGVAVYYDSFNDWLFLDWEGDLAQPAVQTAGVAVARWYLPRPYAWVLNNNALVTGGHRHVARWFAQELLPHLALAGAAHAAWVNAGARPGRRVGQTVRNGRPGPAINCFPDVDGAMAWLTHVPRALAQGSTPPRTFGHQGQLERVVHELGGKIAGSVPVRR